MNNSVDEAKQYSYQMKTQKELDEKLKIYLQTKLIPQKNLDPKLIEEHNKKLKQSRFQIKKTVTAFDAADDEESDFEEKKMMNLKTRASFKNQKSIKEPAQKVSYIKELYDKIETKKKSALEELPSKLESPFRHEKRKMFKSSKNKLPDPLKKILQTNNRIQKAKINYNQKLLKILERVELDRPILMRDKLEIIWGTDNIEQLSQSGFMQQNQFPSESNQQKSNYYNGKSKSNSSTISADEDKIINQYNVKTQLERKKVLRGLINQKQIQVYNNMLAYID